MKTLNEGFPSRGIGSGISKEIEQTLESSVLLECKGKQNQCKMQVFMEMKFPNIPYN
jgi:hypothetical protein